MVRAKCVVTTKITSQYSNSEAISITLLPVTSGSEENKAFFESTPSGKIELNVLNKAAADQFIPGKDYYVDFTEAV